LRSRQTTPRKTAARPVSRLFLVALLGACTRHSGEVTAEKSDTGGGAPPASSTDNVPDSTPVPAPTFAEPQTPEQGLGPYRHPLFHMEGPLGWPRGQTLIESVDVIGGKVGNADSVVAKGRAGFRACYNRGLASDLEQRGSLRIEATLNQLGGVTDAKVDRAGRLSQEVADCVLRRVSTMTFAKPEGDGVRVVISLSFGRTDAVSEPPDGSAPRESPRL